MEKKRGSLIWKGWGVHRSRLASITFTLFSLPGQERRRGSVLIGSKIRYPSVDIFVDTPRIFGDSAACFMGGGRASTWRKTIAIIITRGEDNATRLETDYRTAIKLGTSSRLAGRRPDGAHGGAGKQELSWKRKQEGPRRSEESSRTRTSLDRR